MLPTDPRRHAVYSDAARVYMLMGYVPGGELFSHLQAAPRRRLSLGAARFFAPGHWAWRPSIKPSPGWS